MLSNQLRLDILNSALGNRDKVFVSHPRTKECITITRDAVKGVFTIEGKGESFEYKINGDGSVSSCTYRADRPVPIPLSASPVDNVLSVLYDMGYRFPPS